MNKEQILKEIETSGVLWENTETSNRINRLAALLEDHSNLFENTNNTQMAVMKELEECIE